MTLTVKEKFDKAVSYIQNLPKDGPHKPDQATQLKYYAYFKQVNVGDVNTSRPTGFFVFAEQAKWDAWNGVKGTSTEDAQQKYVDLLVEHLEKIKSESKEPQPELEALLKELKE